MAEWNISSTFILFIRRVTVFLHVGALSSTALGDHSKQQNHQQRVQKCETRGSKQTVKRTLAYSLRTETRSRVSPSLTSTGNVCPGEFKFLPHSACLQVTAKVSWVLTLSWNKCWQYVNSQIWNLWIKRTGCIYRKWLALLWGFW